MSDRPHAAPAFAVIIPTLNAARTLPRTLASLAAQATLYEAFIVDGGSTDGTVAIATHAQGITFIESPGSSLYEALNLGIARASAAFICLLNADDVLLPGALAAVMGRYAEPLNPDIVRGLPEFVEANPDGTLVHDVRNERRAPKHMDLRTVLMGPLAINSMFISRKFFDRVGPFDPAFRFAADRDWVMRAWASGGRIAELERPVYRYFVHPGSQTLDRARRNYQAIRVEHLSIARRELAKVARGTPLFCALEEWHARETGLLGIYLLGRMRWLDAAKLGTDSFSTAPFWPVELASDALKCIWRRRGHT